MSTAQAAAQEASDTSFSDNPSIFLLDPVNLTTVWRDVEQYIYEALTDGIPRNDLGDIYDKLLRGEMHLWMVYSDKLEAVVVTRFIDYPLAKALRIVICIGKGYNRWVHLIQEIERWARQMDCGLIECVARPGWERVLHDYKKSHVILERRLDDA